MDAIQWGGGSTRIVPCSLKADAIQWGGGGGSNRNFKLSSVAKSHFYPIVHRVIFVGRDTHFLLDTAKNKHFLLTTKNHYNCPNSVIFWDISVRPGDHE